MEDPAFWDNRLIDGDEVIQYYAPAKLYPRQKFLLIVQIHAGSLKVGS
jgi:hypothetical protein